MAKDKFTLMDNGVDDVLLSDILFRYIEDDENGLSKDKIIRELLSDIRQGYLMAFPTGGI